jgi:hypothetical protein
VINIIEASEQATIVSVAIAIQKLMIIFTFATTVNKRARQRERCLELKKEASLMMLLLHEPRIAVLVIILVVTYIILMVIVLLLLFAVISLASSARCQYVRC